MTSSPELQLRRVRVALKALCWYERHPNWTLLRHITHLAVGEQVATMMVNPIRKSWRVPAGALRLTINADYVTALSLTQLKELLGTVGDMLNGAEPTEGLEAAITIGSNAVPATTKGNLVLDLSDEAAEQDKRLGGSEAGGVAIGRYITPTSAMLRWEGLLAELIDTAKTHETWARRPKRTLNRKDIVLPGRRTESRKHGIIAVDVSGSINDEVINLIAGLLMTSPRKLDLTIIAWADDAAPWDFRGGVPLPDVGAGTNPTSLEDYCRRLNHYPDAVVVLSDGACDIPDVKFPRRWCWLLHGKDASDRANDFRNAEFKAFNLMHRLAT